MVATMTATAPRSHPTPRSNSHPAGLLELVAVITALSAAAGSVALQLYAGRRSPQHLVLLLIATWVLSPFVALVLLNSLSKHWQAFPRRAHHCVMLLVSVVSLAIYGTAVVRPLASKPPAFVFVAVPPGSLILAAVTLATSWLIARKLHNDAAQ